MTNYCIVVYVALLVLQIVVALKAVVFAVMELTAVAKLLP